MNEIDTETKEKTGNNILTLSVFVLGILWLFSAIYLFIPIPYPSNPGYWSAGAIFGMLFIPVLNAFSETLIKLRLKYIPNTQETVK